MARILLSIYFILFFIFVGDLPPQNEARSVRPAPGIVPRRARDFLSYRLRGQRRQPLIAAASFADDPFGKN